MAEDSVIVFTRFDGLFLIGESPQTALFAFSESKKDITLYNPAMIVHVPVQVQSRISSQAAIAYQTNVVFLDCALFRLPPSVVPTLLDDSDGLAKHYRATLDLRKAGKQQIVIDRPKH